MIRSAALVFLIAVSATARGEEPTFEALGSAQIVGGDTVRARDRALDEAFRQAVEQAVATILTPQAIAERAAQLKLSVIPRARGYVATYRIVEEGVAGPLFQVRVSAEVALARLAKDVQAPSVMKVEPAPKWRAAVCVVEQREGALWIASPVEKGVVGAVAAHGVAVAALGGKCAPAVRRTTAASDELDDEQAGALARAVGAQGAVIGAVQIRSTAAIRGASLPVAHAHARLHLVEADGRPTAVAEAEADAWAPTVDGAGDAALRIAIEEATRSLGPQLAERWPSPSVAGASVVIHVSGALRFAALQSLMRALQSVPGVGAVTPRHFDGGGVDLVAQTTTPATALAGALGHAPVGGDGLSFAAEPVGDHELRVLVIPAPPPPPPPGAPPIAPTTIAAPPG